MKSRLLKLISKPRTAIGVSLLDVISNALASIILLYFVFAALRGQPRPPERQVGILIIDFMIECENYPEIKIYVKRPADASVIVDSLLERNLDTEDIDTVRGIWDHAIILASTDKKKEFTRRLVYINPEKDGEWTTGVIFADRMDYTTTSYNAKVYLSIHAYFVNPQETKELINLYDLPIDKNVKYPSERLETKFRLPEYNNEKLGG